MTNRLPAFGHEAGGTMERPAPHSATSRSRRREFSRDAGHAFWRVAVFGMLELTTSVSLSPEWLELEKRPPAYRSTTVDGRPRHLYSSLTAACNHDGADLIVIGKISQGHRTADGSLDFARVPHVARTRPL